MVSDIPAIGGSGPRLSHRGQIAVEVVGLCRSAERELLIVDVIARRGERRRDGRAGEGPADLDRP